MRVFDTCEHDNKKLRAVARCLEVSMERHSLLLMKSQRRLLLCEAYLRTRSISFMHNSAEWPVHCSVCCSIRHTFPAAPTFFRMHYISLPLPVTCIGYLKCVHRRISDTAVKNARATYRNLSMPPKRTSGLKRPRSADVQCWLMKSEPHKFSIDHLAQMTVSPWDGVRNYAARNNMKAMHVGDNILFYHSNTKEPGVAGLAEVAKLAYDDYTALDKKSEYYDPKASNDRNPWQMVDVRFVSKFAEPVTLHQMKNEKVLQSMALFSQSRLSVQPVSRDAYEHILHMATARASEATAAPLVSPPPKKSRHTAR